MYCVVGICFDLGGYNIKMGVNCVVEFMKFDMGGVGVVFGVVLVIGVFKLKGVEVLIVIGDKIWFVVFI